MKDYYNRRATEYEKIYHKPERQDDLRILKSEVKSRLQNQSVLEVACGTGYWTAVISESAASLCASDQSRETLEIARAKPWPSSQIVFVQDDAYSLAQSKGEFSAAFAGFWWSHVPKHRLTGFLLNLHSRLRPGAKVIFIDNNYVEGSSTSISRTDPEGNTYQIRQLENGESHEILKNFPSDTELLNTINGIGLRPEILRLKYYWLFEYQIRPR